MEKSLFKNILSIVNENIDECKKYLDKVKTTEDLKNLTINQLIELRTICRKQQSRMDSVLRCELYHLIGMGQLTIIQQTQLLSLIKKWTTYRGDIKTITSNLTTIDSLPSLPTESTYDCKVLKVKLTSKGRVANDFTQELLLEEPTLDEADSDTLVIPTNITNVSRSDKLKAVCHKNGIEIEYLPDIQAYRLKDRKSVRELSMLLGNAVRNTIFKKIIEPNAAKAHLNEFNQYSYGFNIDVTRTLDVTNVDKCLIIRDVKQAAWNRIENLYEELTKSK